MTTGKLNGSIDLLAKAMRDVFKESLEAGLVPVRKDINDMRENIDDLRENMESMENRLAGQIKTTNENVQAQLAQHRKDIAADVKKLLAGR